MAVMGYRGKVVERQSARSLRAAGLTLDEIASRLGVAKSSVSLWVRDVDFVAAPRRTGARRRGPSAAQQRKAAEVKALREAGRQWVGVLSEREFLMAGLALYAGEGSKTDGSVRLANTNAELVRLFCAWLRRFFDIDESRLRVRLYLHKGLDLTSAESYWSAVTGIPLSQFRRAYRAEPDPSIRHTKHENGCAVTIYSCSRTHRSIMGMLEALYDPLSWPEPARGLGKVPHLPG